MISTIAIAVLPLFLFGCFLETEPLEGRDAGQTLGRLSCMDGQVPTWNQGNQAWACGNVSGGAFTISGSGTDEVATYTGGKVGIGTATPGARLDIDDADENTTTSGVRFSNFSCDTTTGKLVVDDSTGALVCGEDQGGSGGGNVVDTLEATLMAGNDAGELGMVNLGALGIGTADPITALHVAGTNVNSVGMALLDGRRFGAHAYLGLYGALDQNAGIIFGEDGNSERWRLALDGSSHAMELYNYELGTVVWNVDWTTGNMGVNKTNPMAKLHVGGAVLCDGGCTMSSREKKHRIRDLDTADAVDVLAALRPTRFFYNHNVSDERLGFIAEDVPELVATPARQGLDAMDLVAVLVKVVQAQRTRLQGVSERVTMLTETSTTLRAEAVQLRRMEQVASEENLRLERENRALAERIARLGVRLEMLEQRVVEDSR